MPSLLNRALAKRVMGRGEGALESIIYSRSKVSRALLEDNPSWGADILGLSHNNRYQTAGGGGGFTRGNEAWGEVVSSQREAVKTPKFSGGKGSYKNPTTGVRLPGRSAAYASPPPPAAPVPKVSASTNPIKAVASTGKPFGWAPALGGGFLAGGFTSTFMAAPEDRGVGTFVKGGLFGMAGGTSMNYLMGSGVLGKGTAMARAIAVNGGHSTASSWAGSAHQMARMAQSKESRAMAFGAGAMLAGGLAGSGRSKAHGINGNRGNRFGG
jgi:hypothetical protein